MKDPSVSRPAADRRLNIQFKAREKKESKLTNIKKNSIFYYYYHHRVSLFFFFFLVDRCGLMSWSVISQPRAKMGNDAEGALNSFFFRGATFHTGFLNFVIFFILVNSKFGLLENQTVA